MQRVGRRGSERDLGIARDIDRAPRARSIGEAQPPELDVVFRRDDDLGVRFDVVVEPAKLRPSFGEYRLVVRRPLERRLVCGRPEVAARHVADVAERAPVVAGAVFAPAGYGKVFPFTVAAAGIGNHNMIPPVRQQLHFRYRCIRSGDDTQLRFRNYGRHR